MMKWSLGVILYRNFISHYDVSELRSMALFEGRDWENMHEVDPPFVPQPGSDTDTSYFEGLTSTVLANIFPFLFEILQVCLLVFQLVMRNRTCKFRWSLDGLWRSSFSKGQTILALFFFPFEFLQNGRHSKPRSDSALCASDVWDFIWSSSEHFPNLLSCFRLVDWYGRLRS